MTTDDLSIVAPIALGETSAVYEAERARDGRRFAVKVLTHDELELRIRFALEARALAKLSHPNVVPILGQMSTPGGRPCILMPLLLGDTLRARLDTLGAMGEARAVSLFAEVLAGLDAAHAAGILHRDLSTRNIFLGRASEEPAARARPILIDFGLAKLSMSAPESELSRRHPPARNPSYTAPERILGQPADARSDVYSAGALLFEAIAGRPPFVSTDPDEIVLAHLERNPPPLDRVASVRPEVARAVGRALEKRAADRFPSARAFAAALRSAVGRGGPDVARALPRSTPEACTA